MEQSSNDNNNNNTNTNLFSTKPFLLDVFPQEVILYIFGFLEDTKDICTVGLGIYLQS